MNRLIAERGLQFAHFHFFKRNRQRARVQLIGKGFGGREGEVAFDDALAGNDAVDDRGRQQALIQEDRQVFALIEARHFLEAFGSLAFQGQS